MDFLGAVVPPFGGSGDGDAAGRDGSGGTPSSGGPPISRGGGSSRGDGPPLLSLSGGSRGSVVPRSTPHRGGRNGPSSSRTGRRRGHDGPDLDPRSQAAAMGSRLEQLAELLVRRETLAVPSSTAQLDRLRRGKRQFKLEWMLKSGFKTLLDKTDKDLV